jgi:hypothetical protein
MKKLKEFIIEKLKFYDKQSGWITYSIRPYREQRSPYSMFYYVTIVFSSGEQKEFEIEGNQNSVDEKLIDEKIKQTIELTKYRFERNFFKKLLYKNRVYFVL